MNVFGHPDDVAFAEESREFALSGQPREGRPPHVGRVRTASGDYIWMQGVPATLFDEEGRPCGALTVMRDVTETMLMTEELERRRAEAESLAATKSEFMANMTHELRTEKDLPAETRRRIGVIREASRTLLGIIDDVLDFSRLDGGAMAFEDLPFDPVETARQSLEMVAEQARAKGLTLSLDVDASGDWLEGDANRLQQVLLNFLSNAVKFTARGEIRLAVRRFDSETRARLRIEVSDTGVGVPPDQIGVIFSRFSQADASVSRRFGGSGLGLAICKAIIEAMGGMIGVESQPGQGSTFWFEVNLPKAEAARPAEDSCTAPVQGLKILVVDDNAVNRELVRALLSPFELDIHEASDGVEALEKVSAEAFDLVLMDIQMPTMDGLTATRRIRSLPSPRASRTAIVAMSANVLPDQVSQCVEAGMDGHIGKPIKPAELLGLLAGAGAAA
jgi:signal transduction histidine kinase